MLLLMEEERERGGGTGHEQTKRGNPGRRKTQDRKEGFVHLNFHNQYRDLDTYLTAAAVVVVVFLSMLLLTFVWNLPSHLLRLLHAPVTCDFNFV